MSVYVCRGCKYQQGEPWSGGLCPNCNGLYRCIEIGQKTTEQKQRSTFAAAADSPIVHVATGLAGFDEVTDGGLVAGSAILIAGIQGGGKTSIMCMVADAIAKIKGHALYASSEEGVRGIHAAAHRLGLLNPNVEALGNQLSVESVIEYAKEKKPFVTIFDSLNCFASDYASGAPGSNSQDKAVATAIVRYCRESNRCALIANQLSKSGEVKGTTDAGHAVDTVIHIGFPLASDEDAPLGEHIRILFGTKNRVGAENLKTYWSMHGKTDPHPGLLEHVPARSRLTDNVIKLEDELASRRGRHKSHEEIWDK